MSQTEISQDAVTRLHSKLNEEAESAGYHLNPDVETTKELVKGLLVNEIRYGYWACPCRLASGKKVEDLDIICPCDYRDPDLDEYGTCFCGLYVSKAIINGEKEINSIPERRPSREERQAPKSVAQVEAFPSLPVPVWRCNVCGYLCAREGPPEVCPICKARKERFARFI